MKFSVFGFIFIFRRLFSLPRGQTQSRDKLARHRTQKANNFSNTTVNFVFLAGFGHDRSFLATRERRLGWLFCSVLCFLLDDSSFGRSCGHLRREANDCVSVDFAPKFGFCAFCDLLRGLGIAGFREFFEQSPFRNFANLIFDFVDLLPVVGNPANPLFVRKGGFRQGQPLFLVFVVNF